MSKSSMSVYVRVFHNLAGIIMFFVVRIIGTTAGTNSRWDE